MRTHCTFGRRPHYGFTLLALCTALPLAAVAAAGAPRALLAQIQPGTTCKPKTPHKKKVPHPRAVNIYILRPPRVKVVRPKHVVHVNPRPRVVHHSSVLIHNAPVRFAPTPVPVNSGAAAMSGAPLPGLAARWPGDQNPLDVMGTSSGIFQEGKPTDSMPDAGHPYAAGKIGAAFNFSGTETTFKVPNVVGLAPGNAPHSIVLWVNPTAFPETGRAWLLLLGKPGAKSLSDHWTIHPDGRLDVGPWGGVKSLSGNLKAGAWTHVATTFDGTTLTLYLNGIVTASRPAQFDLQGIPFMMGKRQTPGSHSLDALVNDVAIYNRALTAAEVTALYQAGNAGTP